MQIIVKILSNPICAIVLFVFGFSLGKIYDWTAFKINTTIDFNLFDVFSLLITVSIAIYVAKILEADLQKKQSRRDIWIDRFCQLEAILGRLSQIVNGSAICFHTVVNIHHQLRSKYSHIMKMLKVPKDVLDKDKDLANLMKNINTLKRLLSETPVNVNNNKKNQKIKVQNGVLIYSNERLSEINRYIELIDNSIFMLKLKFASSNTSILD